ncbi:MAG: RNA methyltransferase [Candidatus Margulisiibacteriota bacterium]|jgi:TrmH family RNA methyltransferase
MLVINSDTNSKFKLVKALLADKKARDQEGLFVLEFPKAIAEIDPGQIQFVVATGEDQTTKFSPYIEKHYFAEKLFHKLSDTKTPQGVLAVVKQPRYSLTDIKDGVLVVLDGVQDPGNVGTIIRTAAAFECAGVAFTKDTVDPFSPKVVRASAGSIMQIPIIKLDNAKELKKNGYFLIVTDSEQGKDLKIMQLAKRCAMVFGSEGSGVSKEYVKIADEFIRIIHSKKVESLNVAVSAGIILSRI